MHFTCIAYWCTFRFVHLLVDPALVTLGCVPFLLITGLPRANYIENCLLNTTPASALLLQPTNLTDDLHPILGHIPLPQRYSPPGVAATLLRTPSDCLYSQFYWTVNSTQVAALFDGNNSTMEHAQTLLVGCSTVEILERMYMYR